MIFVWSIGSLPLTSAIERRRQVAHDRVQQRLHALVAIGRAQVHGREFLLDHRVADDVVDQLLGDLLPRSSSISISLSLYIESASSMCVRAVGGLLLQVPAGIASSRTFSPFEPSK